MTIATMAILATLETAPDFPAQHQIDVAACGSTTGSLIRFINSWGKMFRMLVEIVDDRVFLIRREREREFPYGAYPGHIRLRSVIPRKLRYMGFRRKGTK